MEQILLALWIFFPAALANMAPTISNNIPILKYVSQPIDMGKKIRGKRILGDHKTFRGLISGVIGGFLGGIVQMILYTNFSWARSMAGPIDYSTPEILLIGAVLGFGALLGDSVKSFFKRQINIPPGKGWFPFDQMDFIIGSSLLILPFAILPLGTFYIALAGVLFIHPVFNILSWILKLQPRPF